MKRTFILSSIAALLSLPAAAQISFGGEPLGTKAEKLGLPEAPLVLMPHVDVAALMAEDAAREASHVPAPYRFGFNHAVDLTLDNSGIWNVLPNGDRLWRLSIACPGAFSINFEFNTYVVPPGAKVFVFNPAGEHLGAFTAESNPGHPELGVTQLVGDRITVEYQEPAAVAGQGQLGIGQVTHAYRDVLALMKGFGDSGSCNNNVICPEGVPWEQEISSVAMITVGGSGLCTGSLVNNCANDGTPYFLTANHCTQGGVGNWVFRFNWESPTCTPTTNGPTNQTVSGCSLLVNNGGSDVALLQLNSTPPASYGVYYSGWDASGTTPSNQTCIHHPSGDIKKISFDYNAAVLGSFGGAQCWHILAWDDGTTEPGSSGSGLWNQDHRIIGQLYGGVASCSNNVDDYFGRFDVSFPLLDTWLGSSCGNAIDGYDPNGVTVQLDAGVQSIDNVQDSYCNESSITPSITLKNYGVTTLTSVTLMYQLDGGPSSNQNWNGSLATGATTSVALPALFVGNGDHTLTVTATAPNGGTDLNTANDSKSKDFSMANPGQTITLNITLDDYGSETTWELESGGNVIFAGGPYSDGQDGTVVSEDMCVPIGCFTLTLFDSYGDGICCGFGNGDYEVVDAFNNVLLNGNGQFATQVSSNFCVTGIAETGALDLVSVWPNPGTGQFTVMLPDNAGQASFQVVDAIGQLVFTAEAEPGARQVALDLGRFTPGIYTLRTELDGTLGNTRIVLQR